MIEGYKVIDFHTHAFPDAIAERTMKYLAERGGMTPRGNGTAAALKAHMRESGVSLAVNLPVVTKPSQYRSVNDYAAALNAAGGEIMSFGGIHPESEDLEGELDGIVSRGLRGIKLHPDYQGVRIDDPRFIAVVRAALARGLHVVTHAGLDLAYPDDVHAMPEATARLLDALGDLPSSGRGRLILAHLGGVLPSEQELRRHIIGREVVLDLAYIIRHLAPEQLCAIIRAHGADRVIFGSDYPWSDPKADACALIRSGLSGDELRAVLSGNAERLLAEP